MSEIQSSDQAFDICGLGMTIIDLVQVVEDFPGKGGVTEARENCLMGGGPVPTALCTAAKLGARTAIIDRIGDDWRGHLARQEYRSYGVNTDSLALEPGKTTTFACILVRRGDGERHIIYSPGDFTPLSDRELPADVLRKSKILHLNARHWPACLAAAEMVRSAGGLVSFDGGAHRYRPEIHDLLKLSDITIVARDFAEKFSGSENPEIQLDALLATGVGIAGITSGDQGSWFATARGERFHQPAYSVPRVVDTTGCGDAFHGSFLYARVTGRTIRESATFASAAAAINATALGGRGNLPTLPEVENLIQKATKQGTVRH